MKSFIENPNLEKEKIVTFLNTLLADEYALYTKTRNAHWNINEPRFYQLHKFFENQYVVLDAMIDDIAERVRSLGHYAMGSLKEFLRVTHMVEENNDFNNPKQVIQSLAKDHETIIQIIINDITPVSAKYKELGVAEFVDGLMEQHQKMASMLKAFLSVPEISNISDQT